MATLQDVFQKIAQAQPLDGQEEALWLAFLNRSEAVDYKVGAMAVGQSTVTALSQISNNAGRLTNGEYISPADPNVPYPEDENFTGVVQDSDGIRGINSGILQFELRSEDGKAYAGAGAVEIDEDGISFPRRGSDGIVWGSLSPSLDEPNGASIYATDYGIKITSWRYLSEQLLNQTDFTSGITGWSIQSGSFDVSSHPSHGSVLLCTSDGEVLQGRFPVVAGRVYFIVGRMFRGATQASVQMRFFELETGGVSISSPSAEAPSSAELATATGIFTAPAGSAYAEIRFFLSAGDYAHSFSVSYVDACELSLTSDNVFANGQLVAAQEIITDDYIYTGNSLIIRENLSPEVIDNAMQTSIFSKNKALYRKTQDDEKRILTEDDATAAAIHAASEKTTPADDDEFGIADSAASWVLKRLKWSSIKSAILSYLRPTYIREKLTANRTYYVRTDGSDSNDGLTDSAGGAFLTIQKAIVEFRKLDTSVYNTKIKIGNGTYTGAISLADWLGSGELTIEGDTTTPSNVVISTTGESAITINSTLTKRLTITGMRLQTATSGNCLIIAQPAQVEMSAVEFHTCAGHHIVLSGPCNLVAVGNYAITGSPALSHIEFSVGAKFACEYKTVTLTGTPNWPLSFVYGWRTGVALFAGTTYSGSATGQRYSAITNAVIDTGGGGANHLPGDSAGATATGGQYV